jgi:hypothetical protein
MPRISSSLLLVLSLFSSVVNAQQPSPAPKAMNLAEWRDNFGGSALDADKWERFTFEGGSGGTVEVKEGQLRMRGMGGSRCGVRSKPEFTGDRFIVEATVSKVGASLPEPDQPVTPPGNAILTVLFDSSGRNRIEWLITSEGTFEAWSAIDGRLERLDNRNLATKAKDPVLSIARKGDDYFFALNGQVGLRKTIRNLPHSFHLMLYGYGSSENNWTGVRVVTPK